MIDEPNQESRIKNQELFMGQEAKCTLTFRRARVEGTALLETDALIFRGGDVRLSVPYRDIASVSASDDALRVEFGGGVAVFAVGPVAARWADRIRNPPTRLDKLGIRPGAMVILVDVKDEAFAAEIAARGARVSTRLAGEADVIVLGAERRDRLGKLAPIQRHLKRDGAIWVIRPKGVDAITERDVMQAGWAAGLVDVKVARFSETHTAEKFVIPVRRR
jgi:hypothetical protein